MTLVFVYGTLKSGLWNNRLLKGLEHQKALTVDEFVMHSHGVPFMVQKDKSQEGKPARIRGEVYECNDAYLASLDRLEGYRPEYHGQCTYNRTPIQVELADKSVIEAHAYVVLRDLRSPYEPRDADGYVDWQPNKDRLALYRALDEDGEEDEEGLEEGIEEELEDDED